MSQAAASKTPSFQTSMLTAANAIAQSGPKLSAREKALVSIIEQLAGPGAPPLRAESTDSLREMVRTAAMDDARFNQAPAESDNCMGGIWVSDLMSPENGQGWRAAIQAMDGKLYECPFTIGDGKITLGDTAPEVTRTTTYQKVMAKHAPAESATPALRARFAVPVSDSDTLMFMPGGDHVITPIADQGSAELTVRIDKNTPAVLNASLQAVNQRLAPQRVFIDKEHEGKEATAWPEEFFWSESPQPGVYARVEFSALGKQLIQGKIIRAFSPSFTTDAALPRRIGPNKHIKVAAGKRGSQEDPARVTGLVWPDAGTLTNNPAFTKILPLWAKDRSAACAAENATGAH